MAGPGPSFRFGRSDIFRAEQEEGLQNLQPSLQNSSISVHAEFYNSGIDYDEEDILNVSQGLLAAANTRFVFAYVNLTRDRRFALDIRRDSSRDIFIQLLQRRALLRRGSFVVHRSEVIDIQPVTSINIPPLVIVNTRSGTSARRAGLYDEVRGANERRRRRRDFDDTDFLDNARNLRRRTNQDAGAGPSFVRPSDIVVRPSADLPFFTPPESPDEEFFTADQGDEDFVTAGQDEDEEFFDALEGDPNPIEDPPNIPGGGGLFDRIFSGVTNLLDRFRRFFRRS